MTTGNSKSASARKKSQAGRKPNSQRKKSTAKKQENTFAREVVLWIVIAISILLFISNFGVGGAVGNTVSRFFFGLFGLIAYVFPVVLLTGTFFAVSNKGNRIAAVKIIAACLFVAFLCLFIELVMNGAEVKSALAAYTYSYQNKFGGGLVGGALAWLLCPNFGLAGSYVIDAIVLIISLVLITERSAFQGMQKGGRKVYESAKITNERHREKVEAKREERELRRMDRKVEGVALDTRVLPGTPQQKSDEISEINAEQFFDLPEIKEEKHVTLTAANVPMDEPVMTPSAFSDEAMEAAGAGGADSFGASSGRMAGGGGFGAVSEHMAGVDGFGASPDHMAVADGFGASPDHIAAAEEQTRDSWEPADRFAARGHETDALSASSAENGKSASRGQNLAKNAPAQKENGFSIEEELLSREEPVHNYVFPPTSLLKKSEKKSGDSKLHLQETALKLQQTLKNFGVSVKITNISCGPAVTRYELQPEMGVKVSKIVNLADDIKLNLAAADIRIEAPIPGKAAIGIEVPNKENVMVSFRELVEAREFQDHPSKLAFCVGKDIGGKVTVSDIAKMPHLLIAGATGSGKSVCINTIIMSILYKADPKEVKLIMVDPKVVELSVYNGIPHLMIPVVTDPKKAAGALHWAVAEMTDRYQKFAEANVRDLKGYNAKVEGLPSVDGEEPPQKMPQIVIIVDELADLMMVAPGDVEEAICRLAQLARAAGIHLIIATQRPSVNVITGLIKANMPSRIAFAVTSGIDSRTILDMNGAEKLLGKGDMLFNPQGVPKPIRVQGAFVSDKEVSDVVSFLKEQNGQVTYSAQIEEKMNELESSNMTVGIDSGGTGDGRDPYFSEAAKLLIDKEKGSIGMLQRYFKVGFNRAARIMDQLEEAGIVGPEEGTKPRRVLMSPEQFEQYEEESL